MEILGIDIGGSGIKGAPVDIRSGCLTGERTRIETPTPATPAATIDAVCQLINAFKWQGPIGIGFPAVIRHQTIATAANIDDSWIGCDGKAAFSDATGCPVEIVNDADAAGLAEMQFGAARDRTGSVLILTVGTGIGSALFRNQRLFPNTEFGHIEMHGVAAEKFASGAVRKMEDLSWEVWGNRFNEYLQKMERLLTLDTIIIGGGVSKKFGRFAPLLNLTAEVFPATLLNHAGIIGAAFAYSLKSGPSSPDQTAQESSKTNQAQ